MVANFAAGGAAINVLAREAGARLVVVDAGVVEPCRARRALAAARRRARRTSRAGPAMTREHGASAALEAGAGLAAELATDGIGLVALGEMGIGNTTAAARSARALLPAEPARGRAAAAPGSTTRASRARSRSSARALDVERRDPATRSACSPRSAASRSRCSPGVALGCAAERVPVVLDGFITGAAALVAARLAPDVGRRDDRVAPLAGAGAHARARRARARAAARPRPAARRGHAAPRSRCRSSAASLAILDEMATFEDAGVTDAGR